eukprot:CAMPEP_0185905458 /NCGR_PEP_ID=MMETSP0196C-20130402/4669_1 /TAXON_ID=2932 /ORGANISM="Alexandrium fundyense, Strain CCMP1719" /LENGTH=31 /DNA_ID= /DNA_START= /DNA_END= /DNA_ORIENTATION=
MLGAGPVSDHQGGEQPDPQPLAKGLQLPGVA